MKASKTLGKVLIGSGIVGIVIAIAIFILGFIRLEQPFYGGFIFYIMVVIGISIVFLSAILLALGIFIYKRSGKNENEIDRFLNDGM